MTSRNLQFKLTFVTLFVLCTASMFFYVGNLSHIESNGNVQPLVFRNLLISDSDHLLKHKRYLSRHHHVLDTCQQLGKANDIYTLQQKYENRLFDHILVDQKHKLLYCYVPKVACTNWKRVFMVMTGHSNTSNILSIPASIAHRKGLFSKLNNYSLTDVIYMLNTYLKFIVVRHPFERLLSAYRNKLEQHYNSSKYFQSRFGRFIVKRYRQNPSNESLDKGNDVTFREFAAYITGPDNMFNEHWKPIYNLCHPCLIHYDVIGKYETLYEDSTFVLDYIGIKNITFPHAQTPSSTASSMKKYFTSLSKETVTQLHKIYELDFKLFSYNVEEFL